LHNLLAVDTHKSVPVHPMEPKEAPHILTFGTGWGEGSASRPWSLYLQYPLNWMMGGLQKWFGCFAGEGNPQRFLGRPARGLVTVLNVLAGLIRTF